MQAQTALPRLQSYNLIENVSENARIVAVPVIVSETTNAVWKMDTRYNPTFASPRMVLLSDTADQRNIKEA